MYSVRAVACWMWMLVWVVVLVAPYRAGAADDHGSGAVDAPPIPPAASDKLPSDLPVRLRKQLKQMDRAVAKVHRLAADFTKRQSSLLLRHPLETRGTVRMSGGEVRWDTTQPHPSRTLITDDEVRIFYPEEKRMEVYPLARRFAQFGVGPMPKMSELAKRFTIRQSNPTRGAEVYGLKRYETPPPGLLPLTLTPREKSMRKHVKRLVLVIDTQAPNLRALRITQGDDTRTTYRFTHVRLNPKIDKADLALHPPKGTKVVHPYETKNRSQTRGRKGDKGGDGVDARGDQAGGGS